MSTSFQLRERVVTYIKTHPREVRFLVFFAVLCFVWMQAANIESFIHGVLDGLQDTRPQ
ncbi:MAG: hypothetical protein ACTH0Y_02520 [Luteimonas sp.]